MNTTPDQLKLTAVEISHLWNGYMAETLVHHVFSHFLQHVNDNEMKAFIEHCHKVSKKIYTHFAVHLENEEIPVPRGITEEDINLAASRLFSDIFYLQYIKGMARFALSQYSLAFIECSREDIRNTFLENHHMLEKVDQMVTDMMITKGLYIRHPYISTPKEVHFVKQKNIFHGFESRRRPLNVLEISRLFYNAESNAIGKALMMGFSQVAKEKEVRENFLKGHKLSKKYFKMFSDILLEGDITIPHSFDSEVLDSTEAPFSDRLMLIHVSLLNSYGLGTYGLSLAQCHRVDLIVMYSRLMLEVEAYGSDCAALLISHEWMEEPPLSPNRKELSVHES